MRSGCDQRSARGHPIPSRHSLRNSRNLNNNASRTALARCVRGVRGNAVRKRVARARLYNRLHFSDSQRADWTRPEDETLDYSKWFSDSAARLNDLLTRAAIIWSTSITAINSIELYNLPVVIGGGGPRRNFETIGCLSPSPSPSRSLSRSRTALLLFAIPLRRLYPVRRPGLGEVISRIRRDDELSRSVLPLFRRAERVPERERAARRARVDRFRCI